MTVKTTNAFDLAMFRRTYEEWDIDALLALYADARADPDRPRQPAEQIFFSPNCMTSSRGCSSTCGLVLGVVATVENTIAEWEPRVATIMCSRIPRRAQVLANAAPRVAGRPHHRRARRPVRPAIRRESVRAMRRRVIGIACAAVALGGLALPAVGYRVRRARSERAELLRRNHHERRGNAAPGGLCLARSFRRACGESLPGACCGSVSPLAR